MTAPPLARRLQPVDRRGEQRHHRLLLRGHHEPDPDHGQGERGHHRVYYPIVTLEKQRLDMIGKLV
jgi:hypothetical protein